MTEPQFWKKSWDPGLDDLDPNAWEISYVDAIRPTLEKYADTPAMSFMEIEISFQGSGPLLQPLCPYADGQRAEKRGCGGY